MKYEKKSPSIIHLIGCLIFTILGFILLYLYHHNLIFIKYPSYRMLALIVAWLNIIFFGIIGVPVITMAIIKKQNR